MKSLSLRATLLAMTLASLPLAAHAHRGWLLPSATVLSGNEPWLTVDAAISNDLFYFEHQPMRLDNVKAVAPDGSEAKIENASTGRYRSTFDVKLVQKGTYKVTNVSETIMASYLVNGELNRFRGNNAAFAKDIPADAKDVQVSRNHNRLEIFVTSGKPSDTVLKTTGVGLELAAITHPNDLFVGEAAEFRLLLDGKPKAGVEVTVVPGGIRYRDQLGELKATTDQDGKFNITWPAPGMYWLNATASDQVAAATPGAGGPPVPGAQRPVTPGKRASYTTTLEVLPQ